MAEILDPLAWTCPVPLRDQQRVVLGHGGGGQLSSELIEHLFLPAFDADELARAPRDSAVVEAGGLRLAFTTDSYVVQPLFFPGGSIGDLAVNGTVNDLAMSGAIPLALSSGFILEEGLELDVLGQVAEAMGRAARRADVRLVTGDTKVVGYGAADGLYVNTSGVGLIPEGVDLRPDGARPGDRVIVSGPIGEHGVAIMSVREGIQFGTVVRTDSAPLAGLVQTMLAACPGAAGRGIHVLRDPTRGGLAASLGEIAEASRVGVDVTETAVPVPASVEAACGFLGLDPLHVANEGKLVAFVEEEVADAVLAAMQAHEFGRGATVIGTVTEDHPGMVVGRTALGGTRVIDRPLGEQLPRIC
jgi:hydrogenase expression/formation protein HypE